MITGNGTAESHYIISGDDIKVVWSELLEKIAEKGVYVELDKVYTFDLDKVYEGSTVPKELPIGYNTVVDCKKSSITSEVWTIDNFDFEGERAEIYGLTMPGGIELNPCSALYIADSFERFLTVANEQHYNDVRNNNKNIRARIKLSKKITIDLDNSQDDTEYDIYSGDIQFNGLTIQNGRNVRLRFRNSHSDANSNNKTRFLNLNLLDNIELNRVPLLTAYFCVFHKCHIRHYAKHTGSCFLFASYSNYSNRHINFVSCNLDLGDNLGLYGYDGRNYAPGVFKDCILCLMDLKQSIITGNNEYNNCYIYGKTEGEWLFDNNVNYDNLKQVIIEAETSQSINLSGGGSASGVVINRTLAPNITTSKGGIYFLTTEEIHDIYNPGKLYASGIPINPNPPKQNGA